MNNDSSLFDSGSSAAIARPGMKIIERIILIYLNMNWPNFLEFNLFPSRLIIFFNAVKEILSLSTKYNKGSLLKDISVFISTASHRFYKKRNNTKNKDLLKQNIPLMIKLDQKDMLYMARFQ